MITLKKITSIIDYLTEAEFATASGNIVAQIPTDFYTTGEVDALLVTVSGVSDHGDLTGLEDDDHIQYLLRTDFTTSSGNIVDQIPTDYYTTGEVDGLIAAASGTTDHSLLDNLDYASSSHTGFQPTGDYLTDAEFTIYSGTLQTQIDGKASTVHTHDDRYYTELEVDSLLATVSGGADHGSLTGLDVDDHPQYHNDTRADVRYHRTNFETVTLDSDDIANKYIYLSETPKTTDSLNIFVEGGIKGELGADYTVSGKKVNWTDDGDWFSLLSEGDKLSIVCWY